MFSRIEALRFRCLKYICQPLDPFHVLVGPNASGKTTFLDVIAFLGQVVGDGLETAVASRTSSFTDMIWGRRGFGFELAVEATIPREWRARLTNQELDTIRYELAVALNSSTNEIEIQAEKALLKRSEQCAARQSFLFPSDLDAPETLVSAKAARRVSSARPRLIINKVRGGNDNFYSEVYGESGKGWAPAFRLGPRRSALGNLPEDESKFPVSTWFKQFLTSGVQRLVLNSLLIRRASPPGQGQGFSPDGSNLPWVVDALERRDKERLKDWVAHLQTALPDLEDIRTVERQDDHHRYLVLCYRDHLEVPSWMASDGTLRLLALTLPAYLPEFAGVFLIEEPENGIHPRAVETMFQSLSSVYNAQILMATHSPVILGIVEAGKVLCFAKTPEGATDIVSGSEHPALRNWQGEMSLSTLFAAGVLG
jgi:predicted ATPase